MRMDFISDDVGITDDVIEGSPFFFQVVPRLIVSLPRRHDHEGDEHGVEDTDHSMRITERMVMSLQDIMGISAARETDAES
jgi:hypothetical protein